MDIHHDLKMIKLVAVAKAKEHGCNYIIIIHNPDTAGNYNELAGSSYEFVGESYFDKERPHAKRLISTDEIIAQDAPAQV